MGMCQVPDSVSMCSTAASEVRPHLASSRASPMFLTRECVNLAFLTFKCVDRGYELNLNILLFMNKQTILSSFYNSYMSTSQMSGCYGNGNVLE